MMEKYGKIFLMETSILHLKEVSGHSRAHIMLMNFSSFSLDVKKHNLRLDAQAAENKAYMEIERTKNKK